MLNVAAAIRALHAHCMVARELHPSRILVQDGTQAVVTDLELAKLLEVEGSVSDYWQRNHFRAPEIPAGESHPQADLYSFARIYLHAATGSPLEDDVDDVELLEQVLPAGKLRDQLAACLSPIWQERPESIVTIYNLLNE
jgi:serine/threonine protein kinase